MPFKQMIDPGRRHFSAYGTKDAVKTMPCLPGLFNTASFSVSLILRIFSEKWQ
jgi:hypothetical protein